MYARAACTPVQVRRVRATFRNCKWLSNSAQKRFGFRTGKELLEEATSVVDWIPGFATPGECTLITGSVACCKSWLVTDVATKDLAGGKFLWHLFSANTDRRGAYIDFEAFGGPFSYRMMDICRSQVGEDAAPELFEAVSRRVACVDPTSPFWKPAMEDLKLLKQKLIDLIESQHLNWLIVDGAAMMVAATGGEENSAKDTLQRYGLFDEVAKATGIPVIFIAHCGKEALNKAVKASLGTALRGSFAPMGVFRKVFQIVTFEATDVKFLINIKNSRGPKAEPWAFYIRTGGEVDEETAEYAVLEYREATPEEVQQFNLANCGVPMAEEGRQHMLANIFEKFTRRCIEEGRTIIKGSEYCELAAEAARERGEASYDKKVVQRAKLALKGRMKGQLTSVHKTSPDIKIIVPSAPGATAASPNPPSTLKMRRRSAAKHSTGGHNARAAVEESPCTASPLARPVVQHGSPSSGSSFARHTGSGLACSQEMVQPSLNYSLSAISSSTAGSEGVRFTPGRVLPTSLVDSMMAAVAQRKAEQQRLAEQQAEQQRLAEQQRQAEQLASRRLIELKPQLQRNPIWQSLCYEDRADLLKQMYFAAYDEDFPIFISQEMAH